MSGSRTGLSQAGAARASAPLAGGSQADLPQAGAARASAPLAGGSQADLPQAGAARASAPQAGGSQADLPQAGAPQAGPSQVDASQADLASLSRRARELATAIEPFAGGVYFSPECHEAYVGLGFSPSPTQRSGVAMPDGAAYFCSRGSVMGQVPGQVVAAAFGVFNPAVVVPAVEHGWTLTDAATICSARTEGAVAQLRRILGDEPAGLERATALLQRAVAVLRPEGRPLFAGLSSLGLPGDPLGAAWRLADQLREHRGDAHTASWTSAGFDAAEIGSLTELYWGLPNRSYVRTRAWNAADLDAAEASLAERGLVADGRLTVEGRTQREAVEAATDRQCRPPVEALGTDLDELVAILRPWGAAIRAAGGYPASGPHDLADLDDAAAGPR